MKAILIFALALMNFGIAIAQQAVWGMPQGTIPANLKATDLEVSVVAIKRKYKAGDRIKLDLKITNRNPFDDIFVYGRIEFGYRGSLVVRRRDAMGRSITAQFSEEALSMPPKLDDTSGFVKLLPNHFLGTYFEESLKTLNMARPGKYYLWAEYLSPVSKVDVQLKPFWGKEQGIIKSNVVWIEVLP